MASFQQAALLFGEGKLAEASALARTVVALKPLHVKAWGLVAYAALDSGDTDEAFAAARSALQARPDAPFPLFLLGSCELKVGRHQAALDNFRRAERAWKDPLVATHMTPPQKSRAMLATSVALAELGRPEGESLAALEEAVALTSEWDMSPQYAYELFQRYRKLKRYAEARAMLRDGVLSRDPGNCRARFWLAALTGDAEGSGEGGGEGGGGGDAQPSPEEISAHVLSLYESFADRFDSLLVDKLQYRTPAILAGALRGVVAEAGDTWGGTMCQV